MLPIVFMKNLKIVRSEKLSIELSRGIELIIDLAIPSSKLLPNSTSYYISNNSSKLCFQKFEFIKDSYGKCIDKINEENERKPFKDFASVEFFLKDNFNRDYYLSFIKLFREFIIFSFFSHPIVLKNLPINLEEKDIRILLAD